jgi:hypothetical protein
VCEDMCEEFFVVLIVLCVWFDPWLQVSRHRKSLAISSAAIGRTVCLSRVISKTSKDIIEYIRVSSVSPRGSEHPVLSESVALSLVAGFEFVFD